MAKLDRAALKEFFETGDKPTQEQFADLIDSLLSLVDNSNLANDIKIKSETNGKFQINLSDDYLYITSDGDDWNTAYIEFEPGKIVLQSGDAEMTVQYNAATILRSPDDKELILLSHNVRGLTIINDSIAGFLRFYLDNLGTYADNAAALAGGRALKEVYKTATGELRIVV